MTLVSWLVQVTFPSAEIPVIVVAPGPTIRKKRASAARTNGIVHSKTATATNENRNERQTDLDNPKRLDNFFVVVKGDRRMARAASVHCILVRYGVAGHSSPGIGQSGERVITRRLTTRLEAGQARKKATCCSRPVRD